MSAHGSEIERLAQLLSQSDTVYVVHKGTGEITSHSVREHVRLLGDGYLYAHVVRWSAHEAAKVAAGILQKTSKN